MTDQEGRGPCGFYVTSPLYYVNDRPHLGTAYTTVLTDIFNRFHRLFGRETFFLTGTDEHGQTCQQAAQRRGLSPREHCDEMSARFKEAWKTLDIEYDLFFRTTHRYTDHRKDHTAVVQQVLQKLKDQGDIYRDFYEGWYSVSEEIFYTKKDLVGGKSPLGREVIPIREENYFFKMSRYQKQLKKHLEENPDFIYPSFRQNELKGFLKKPLQDLCISRPKKRVAWGVELPFNRDYVTYVWVDALLNYITGVGYGSEREEDTHDFEKWWRKAGAAHFIGKDILITHGVYWPCLLMALDLPLPKTLVAHGWLLNKDREKMSKSRGDVLDPLALAESFGVSALRYALAREVILGNDAFISKDMMIQRIHQDLSDGPGNILSRLARLTEQYFDGKIPQPARGERDFFGLKTLSEKTALSVRKNVEEFQLSQALKEVSALWTEINRTLEREAPWKALKPRPASSGKTGAGADSAPPARQKAGDVIYSSLEALRISAVLLGPVMPKKMESLLEVLGEGGKPSWRDTAWGGLSSGHPLRRGKPLFPKIIPV